MKKSLFVLSVCSLFLIAVPAYAATIDIPWGPAFNSIRPGGGVMRVPVDITPAMNWDSTSYAIVPAGQTPSDAQFTCVDSDNYTITSGATHGIRNVEMSAPQDIGTYSLFVKAYRRENCSGDPIASGSNILPSGIEVCNSSISSPDSRWLCGTRVMPALPVSVPIETPAPAPTPTPTPPPAAEPIIQTVYVPVYVPAPATPVPAPADEPVIVAGNAATTVDTASREATIESLYRQIIALLTQYLQLLLAAKGQ